MRTRFIINPISGTGKQKGIEDYIAKYLDNYEVFYTKKLTEALEFLDTKYKELHSMVEPLEKDIK